MDQKKGGGEEDTKKKNATLWEEIFVSSLAPYTCFPFFSHAHVT